MSAPAPLLALLVALALLGCAGSAARAPAAPQAPGPARRRGRIRTVSFFSRALGRTRTYLLYTPPGYAAAAAAGRRFPVLYLLHSAPGWPQRFVSAGLVNRYLDAAIAARRARPMLVVMPYGRVALRPGGPDTEWANTSLGRYEDLVLDVVRDVDRRFSTLRSRRGRALAGPSTGGFAAANVALHHLGVFGAFESWSGYFAETRTDAFTDEPQADLDANSPEDYVPTLRAQLARRPLAGIAYQGQGDTEPTGLGVFAQRFRAAGGRLTVLHPPGGHGWTLWKAQEPAMIAWASRHLEAPR